MDTNLGNADRRAIAELAVKQANGKLYRATIDKQAAEICGNESNVKSAITRMVLAEAEVRAYQTIVDRLPPADKTESGENTTDGETAPKN